MGSQTIDEATCITENTYKQENRTFLEGLESAIVGFCYCFSCPREFGR
jgi:hypothetical protein